jgi:Fe-S-cluster containining protein
LERLNKPKEQVTFFHCRNLTNERKCSVHDKRPDLCRHYPVCYEDMFFYENCGYEEQARKNWAEIEKILEKLGNNQ